MLEVRAAVAACKTNREARALLGVAAEYLQRAYALLPDLPNTADVRDQARDLLDRTNLYAQGLYAMIHDDDGALPEEMRPRIQTALSSAQSDMQLVAEVRADLEVDYLRALADILPAGAAALASAAAGAAADHWVLTIVAAVAVLFALRMLRPAVAA